MSHPSHIEHAAQPAPAECCTDLGVEPELRRKCRLGPLTRFERRPRYTFAAVVWLAAFAAAIRVWS